MRIAYKFDFIVLIYFLKVILKTKQQAWVKQNLVDNLIDKSEL